MTYHYLGFYTVLPSPGDPPLTLPPGQRLVFDLGPVPGASDSRLRWVILEEVIQE